MDKDKVIGRLIHLPKEFYDRKTISWYDLVKDSGYFEWHGKISAQDIQRQLALHLECVEEWLGYSGNKRTSSGWYFSKAGEGKYIVGFFGKDADDDDPREFSGKSDACALFIKPCQKTHKLACGMNGIP